MIWSIQKCIHTFTECRYNILFLIRNDIYCCSYHLKIWLLKVHDAYKLEQKRTNYGVNDLWSIFLKLTSSITFFIFLFVVPINQIISRNQDTHYSSSSFVVLTNLCAKSFCSYICWIVQFYSYYHSTTNFQQDILIWRIFVYRYFVSCRIFV